MLRHTLVARESDGLPLVATIENDKPQDPVFEAKQLVKPLVRQLAASGPAPGGSGAGRLQHGLPLECTVRAGAFDYHYIIDGGLIVVAIADATMPRLLAFSFLLEVVAELAEQSNDAAASWRSAVRPYALIRLEPALQAVKQRYANPRSLQSRLDLADLSVRVQSIPVCAIADILPDQIADAQRMTLRRVAENVATAAEQFSTGAGYSRTTRSWRTRYLIMITLCVLFIDVAYAAQFALDWVSKTLQLVGSNVFVIALGLLCPVLLYQARTFQLHTKMIPLARRVTLAHASLTLAQSVYALFVPIEEAALGATASPRYGEGGADLTPLQRAAAFFAAFCIPAPLVITKLLYIATVVLVIGSPFSLRKVRYDKLGHLE